MVSKYKQLIKPNKGIVNPEGQRISIEHGINFSNPKAPLLVTGPNDEFLHKIKEAFQLDACFVRYGASVNGLMFDRIVIFAINGLPPEKRQEFTNWVYYLRTRLKNPEDATAFHII